MTTSIGPTATAASVLNASNNAAAAANPAPASTTGLGSDFNTFLQMLTTQLKNQDPTAPLDTNQMTQQLVSFSQVEQAINQNTKLQSLVSMQSTNQGLAALPLVGHTVQVSDSKGALTAGKLDFGYNLPSQAKNATLTISDSTGRIVYQGTAETAAGNHTFSWDGTGSDGTKSPDGVYSFAVSATAADQSAITAALSAYGKVNSVDMSGSAPAINLGGVSEQISKLIGITG